MKHFIINGVGPEFHNDCLQEFPVICSKFEFEVKAPQWEKKL